MRLARLRRPLVALAIVVALAVSVGGGTTFLALEITTRPQFCKSCHIMEPYYESWETSGHAHVQCVDCHYEPGLLETFEGKFKALSQLAKYVTATQGTKPWAEVSDYSCMRSGCHSTRLLEGEIQFGRIRFDHRHHLIGMRRGKKLRCTSCHGQIVQGDHLTVTLTSCFLCHFRSGEDVESLSDCYKCHGPPEREIPLGAFLFRHDEYLSRGVECVACHGDVTRGTGEVPRSRCGSCHAAVRDLRDRTVPEGDAAPMADLDCLACHEALAEDATVEALRSTCNDCHDEEEDFAAGHYDSWLQSAGAPLSALEQRLAGAPKEPAERVRARIAELRAAGPQHNPAWIRSAASALAEELDAAGR